MRTIIKLVPLALITGALAVQACGTVPTDTGGTALPPAGVIRGTIFYNGPPPCTQDGQVVGNAIILVFDRRNPPPPAGLANTAVNFVAISGDTLFANVPRTTSSTKSCLDQDTSILASAPYAIAPMDPGSYVMQAFYDYTGDFLPTFKFRNLPEAQDIGGGYIDINDANQLVQSNQSIASSDGGAPLFPTVPKSASASYQPIFLPVNIGTPGTVSTASVRDVPDFTMPSTGYIADNVSVYIGSRLPLARPYFYPEGPTTVGANAIPIASTVVSGGSAATRPTKSAKSPGNPNGDLDYEPVLSFPQDIHILGQPLKGGTFSNNADVYQASFPQLLLHWGVPSKEATVAADISSPSNPFHMQLSANPTAGAAAGGNGGFFVFAYDSTDPLQAQIPETLVPRLWPLVVLAKLEDFCATSTITGTCDPTHVQDPQDITYQGSDLKKPVVIIQGITLSGDTLLNTVTSAPSAIPGASTLTDHFTVMLRPNVLCLDPRHIDRGGTLVTPFQCAPYPNNETHDVGTTPCEGSGNILDPQTVTSSPQLATLLSKTDPLEFACLPPGRYGINVVYPTGQAWTEPNEIGSCATLEGNTIVPGNDTPGNCSLKMRPVLYSQGTRATVEITASKACGTANGPAAVPTQCSQLTGD